MAYSSAVHGVTTQTVSRFLVDAGGIFKNYGTASEEQLGATRGGNTFTIEQDVREMEIDGVPGPVMGAERIVAVRARIEANVVELGVDNIKTAIVGSDSRAIDQGATGSTTHQEIYRARAIALTDYLENVAIVGRVLGMNRRGIFIVKNVIQTENFELGMTDEDEGVLTLNLLAHYDPASLDASGQDEEPWLIRWPEN